MGEANNYKLMESNGKTEVEDMLAMMEVLSLCDTNGDDKLSLAEAKICEVCLGLTNSKIYFWCGFHAVVL